MSEKRYVISELDPISVLDMNTGDTFPIADGSGFVETIVECLNTLHEENKQLQHDATILMQSNQDYRKENEQLKKELKVYRKLASCSNCDYHNYDWFDDGDEFEVCDKGNDVTEGICEEWEEL